MRGRTTTLSSLGLSIAAAALALPSVAAAQQGSFNLDIPSQDLSTALKTLAGDTHQQVIFRDEDVRGKRSVPLKGAFPVDTALRTMLEHSGLSASRTGRGIIVVRPAKAEMTSLEPIESAEPAETPDVLVTGTRIRGGAVASPTTTIDRKQFQERGWTDLGQVIRSIPQNYNGGQNPSVLLGAGSNSNQNATSGSALNLRGLGPDATLTLLDGNRLAYGGFAQSIDISAIPLGAVERLEIVTDGASSLYGSDAVAGVANIITRQDFHGLEVSGRLGGATDGGVWSRDASVTGGFDWSGGHALVAYEYQQTAPLYSQDRDYLDYMEAGNIVYPPNRQHSAFANVRQAITSGVTFSVEGLFLDRHSDQRALMPGLFLDEPMHSRVFSIAPKAEFALPAGWQLTVTGTYGEDHSTSISRTTAGGVPLADQTVCDCNSEWSAEASVQGSIFSLPAGDVRLAAGGGYRRNRFVETSDDRLAASFTRVDGHQSSSYGFAELSIPLVSPIMHVAAAHDLVATIAGRYEHYPEFGSVATPKLGLIYEPLSGLTFKGTWGRSFKAPTLSQQLSTLSLDLAPATEFGATGYPAGSAVLFAQGSNGGLKPEKARTWTGTVTAEPAFFPGLKLEATYFDTDYTNRIASPLDGALGRAFIDPAYAQFVALEPSAEQQAALIASAPGGITHNETGAVYDPSTVVGIIYNTYLNIASEHADGVDLDASFRFNLFGGKTVAAGSASWLNLTERLSPGTASLAISGYVFNPPKFRGQGSIAWSKGRTSLAVALNYIGALTDNQEPVVGRLGSFTTADLTLGYRLPQTRALYSGLEFNLTVSNLFDQQPPLRTPEAPYVVNFDSTNHNALGRVISGSITKHW